jgi:hypothetical protein
MKRSKFTTREGLVMLFGITLVFIVILWLMLSGILRINDQLFGTCVPQRSLM